MKKNRNSLVIALIGLIAFSCSQNTVDSGKETEFYVRGNCGMCEERIEKSVMEIEGVNKADWNVETKNLSVSYDSTKTNELAIQQKVANVGHETKTITSPQAVHDALPECCKKGGSM